MGKVAGRWRVGVGLVLAMTLAALAPGWVASPVVAADVPAPVLVAPPPAQPLAEFAVAVTWQAVTDATQYQVQVVPFRNDGPGVNLIRDAASTTLALALPDPVSGPFILLPDMTYTWRVRASSKATFAPETDASWGPWSESRTFRTPRPSPQPPTAVSPANGATVGPGPQLLQWTHNDPALFYWEVQLSTDGTFNTNPVLAIAPVYWNLVHGRVASPPNAWLTPALAPGTYYWRVRARVQGDGAVVSWGPAARFVVNAAAATPTPLPTATPLPPTPTPSPTPGPATPTATPAPMPRVTFETNRDGNFEVYTVRSDGSQQVNLTKNASHDRLPQWSPDGSRIAFVSARSNATDMLWVMGADGSTPRGGSEPVEAFAWSPDSKHLAVYSLAAGLRLVAPDGTLEKELAAPTAYTAYGGVTWTFDSKYVIVSAAGDGFRNLSLYSHEVATRAVRNLTPNNAGDNYAPVFAPAQPRLVFVTNRSGFTQVYALNTGGATGVEVPLTSGIGGNEQPSWSPKGDKIVFVNGNDGNRDIYVMNADGTNQTQLTKDSGEDTSPVWSPDGTKIAWVTDRTGNREVYVMDALDGGNPVNVSANPAIDRNPVWAPR